MLTLQGRISKAEVLLNFGLCTLDYHIIRDSFLLLWLILAKNISFDQWLIIHLKLFDMYLNRMDEDASDILYILTTTKFLYIVDTGSYTYVLQDLGAYIMSVKISQGDAVFRNKGCFSSNGLETEEREILPLMRIHFSGCAKLRSGWEINEEARRRFFTVDVFFAIC